MLALLKRIVQPPVFGDERKDHQAYLLNIILWGVIFVPVPYVLYAVIFAPPSVPRVLMQAGVGETVNLFLLFLLHRGYVRTASITQVTAFWFFFTITAVTEAGVQSEAYLVGYPLVIIIAGILLGGNMAIVTAFISILTGLGMLGAEQIGLIDSAAGSTPGLSWAVSLALFPMGAILQTLSSNTVQRALDRARLSEEKYRLISRVSSDYTFESTVDESGKAVLLWVGGAFKKLTGYDYDEYVSKGGWYGHIHPDDLEKDEEDMRKLFNNEEVIGSEIRTYAKNGEIRWERIFAHPIWDEAENRLTGIIGAVQDVTEQKQAEHMLRETLLRQTAILDNIPDMAWLKDADSRYIAVNEQFLKTSGCSIVEVIGKLDLDIWEQEFAEKYRQDDLEVMQSGVRRQVEERQRDRTGREYWVETIKTPIRNAHGEIIGTIGIARDITERKHNEFERERLIAELEAKNAELERFTYTVSHDLKSPLVTITGFLTYLEKSARAGNFDRFKQDLERIHQAAEKMQVLLKDLLELSRIGRLMNEPVEMSFAEIVQEALALTDVQIKTRGVQVEFADEGHTLRGDRVRLMEVIQNLLDNAVKFMGSQPQPRIRIGAKKTGNGELAYFVQDNGIGIDPQYQERIFGLFNKLDANSHGSGVGLAIVKRIIEVHGGRIWVESQPGQGSTFHFTIKQP